MLVATATVCGVVAGLLYGVAITVNRGLSAIDDDRIYIASHNSINRVITPINSLVFVAPLLLVATTVGFLSGLNTGSASSLLTLAATVLYLVGVLGITITRNVPLFRGLWDVDPNTASPEEMVRIREWHERPWHFWHNLRTVIGIVVFVLTLFALAEGWYI